MLVTVSSEDSLKFDIKHVFRLDVLFFNFFSSVFFCFNILCNVNNLNDLLNCTNCAPVQTARLCPVLFLHLHFIKNIYYYIHK